MAAFVVTDSLKQLIGQKEPPVVFKIEEAPSRGLPRRSAIPILYIQTSNGQRTANGAASWPRPASQDGLYQPDSTCSIFSRS